MIKITDTIFLAEPDDIPKLKGMIEGFYTESPYQGFSLDMQKVLGNLQKMTVDKANSVVFLGMKDGVIVGFIAGIKVVPVFTQDHVALELAWYVVPEHRNSRIGLTLLEAYTRWGKMVGCKFSQFSLLNNVTTDPQAVAKILHMKGHDQTEWVFQKDLRGK